MHTIIVGTASSSLASTMAGWLRWSLARADRKSLASLLLLLFLTGFISQGLYGPIGHSTAPCAGGRRHSDWRCKHEKLAPTRSSALRRRLVVGPCILAQEACHNDWLARRAVGWGRPVPAQELSQDRRGYRRGCWRGCWRGSGHNADKHHPPPRCYMQTKRSEPVFSPALRLPITVSHFTSLVFPVCYFPAVSLDLSLFPPPCLLPCQCSFDGPYNLRWRMPPHILAFHTVS